MGREAALILMARRITSMQRLNRIALRGQPLREQVQLIVWMFGWWWRLQCMNW